MIKDVNKIIDYLNKEFNENFEEVADWRTEGYCEALQNVLDFIMEVKDE